jgi:hypothetical protein
VLDDLLGRQGMRRASDVVLSGCSAGGLAIYLQADHVAARLPASTKFATLADSGYFLREGGTGQSFPWVHQAMNAATNAACEAAEPDPRQCFFAQVVSKYVRSPVFALQSVVDNHQVRRVGASAFISVVASEVRNTVLVFLDQLCVEIGRENGAEMTTSLSNLVSIWGSGLPRLLLQ